MEILFLGVLFGLMYAVMIRPQQKRMREHQSLIRSLEAGDMVVTASGVHGAVAHPSGEGFVGPDVECRSNEYSLVWNIVGPQGHQGEASRGMGSEQLSVGARRAAA